MDKLEKTFVCQICGEVLVVKTTPPFMDQMSKLTKELHMRRNHPTLWQRVKAWWKQ